MITRMEASLMELAYDEARSIVSVRWPDELSVGSAAFFQTIVSLFATIQEKRVANLMIDSGNPAGGLLSEEIIEFFTQNISATPLKNIAIVESPDYLWDNNLYQVITLLVTTHQLPIAVKLVKSHAAGLQWFPQPVLEEPLKEIEL